MLGLAAYQAVQKRLTDRDGRSFPGYLAEPKGQAAGAVLVMHDFFGLAPHVRSVVNGLASKGFVAFAPDLYRGEVATTRERAGELAQRLAWNQIAVELGLAVAALRHAHPQLKVGAIGFAMGGGAAVVAAASVAELSCAITYYGIPEDVVLENRRLPIQGHFASRDDKCTPARVTAFEAMLEARGITSDIHRYDAENGFANPARGDAYSREHAELAMSRTLAFLKAALA